MFKDSNIRLPSNEETVRNDVLIYETYNYYTTQSQQPLVLDPEDDDFAEKSTGSYRYESIVQKVVMRSNDSVVLNVWPRSIKSIQNNSRYYVVLGYRGETRCCVPPKTHDPYIFLTDDTFDTVMFHEEPYDSESRALLKEKCINSRMRNTPPDTIDLSTENIQESDFYILLFTTTNFRGTLQDGNIVKVPLYYLLAYHTTYSLSSIALVSQQHALLFSIDR